MRSPLLPHYNKLTDNSDPPSLLAGTELRDLSFRPTAIHNAHVTIVHPQLRDLILPLHRGRVLFPHGTSIDEMIWTPEDVEDDDEEGVQAAVASDQARGGKVTVSVTSSSGELSEARLERTRYAKEGEGGGVLEIRSERRA